jgi:hypothetical protein
VSSWYSIEVIDGAVSASGWAEAWSDTLSGAALSGGATDWSWHRHSWGVVFETEFADESAWEVFREQPSVRAALDAVPDPVSGIIVYRGRGGSAGSAAPRKPRPMIGSGSAALPLPWDFMTEWPADLSALTGPASWRSPLVGSLV